jgi:2-haloacid dehalogenase
MIKNIVFDFGNVLIDWDPRSLFSKLFSTRQELDNFMRNSWNIAEWNDPLDRGDLLEKTRLALLDRHPSLEREINAYFSRYLETIGSPNYDTIELLYDLQARGYATYGLTNWGLETFSLVRRNLHFFDTFRGIVISGVEKIIKPDPRIYKLLLERYSLTAGETVFIDDREVNLVPARSLGIHTILFTSAQQVREELNELLVRKIGTNSL